MVAVIAKYSPLYTAYKALAEMACVQSQESQIKNPNARISD
jgi:hypothetical protein